MKRLNHVISIAILICFLFNTAVSDLAFSQPLNFNSDKLAASSKWDDIVGIIGQDMGRIDAILRMHLVKSISKDGIVDIEALKRSVNGFRDSQRQAPLEFADHSSLQIYVNETTGVLSDYWRIMCRIKDSHGLRTYQAIFPKTKGMAKDLPLYLYKDEEYKKFEKDLKAGKITLPRREIEKPQQARSIARNSEHQMYDENVLAWVHREKKDSIREVSGADYTQMVHDVLFDAEIIITSNRENLLNKKLYLVARDEAVDKRLYENLLTIVDVEGKLHKIIGYMHTSNAAVHMFVPRSLVNRYDVRGGAALSELLPRFAYEVGKMLNEQPTKFMTSDGDLYHSGLMEVKKGYQYPINDVYERYLAGGGGKRLKEKSYKAAVDLDTNYETRDYAGGTAEGAKDSFDEERKEALKYLYNNYHSQKVQRIAEIIINAYYDMRNGTLSDENLTEKADRLLGALIGITRKEIDDVYRVLGILAIRDILVKYDILRVLYRMILKAEDGKNPAEALLQADYSMASTNIAKEMRDRIAVDIISKEDAISDEALERMLSGFMDYSPSMRLKAVLDKLGIGNNLPDIISKKEQIYLLSLLRAAYVLRQSKISLPQDWVTRDAVKVGLRGLDKLPDREINVVAQLEKDLRHNLSGILKPSWWFERRLRSSIGDAIIPQDVSSYRSQDSKFNYFNISDAGKFGGDIYFVSCIPQQNSKDITSSYYALIQFDGAEAKIAVVTKDEFEALQALQPFIKFSGFERASGDASSAEGAVITTDYYSRLSTTIQQHITKVAKSYGVPEVVNILAAARLGTEATGLRLEDIIAALNKIPAIKKAGTAKEIIKAAREPLMMAPSEGSGSTFLSQEEANKRLNALPTIGDLSKLTAYYERAIRERFSYKKIFEDLKPELAKMAEILTNTRPNDELNQLIRIDPRIQIKQLDILRAVSEFILQFIHSREGVDNLTLLKEIKEVFVRYPEISKLLIDYFETKFDLQEELRTRGRAAHRIRFEITEKLDKISGRDHYILDFALAIMVATIKTDYWLDDRTELFLRIDPKSIQHPYDRNGIFGYAPPFAIIWVHVPYGAYGAHSRYADVARGGLRNIKAEKTHLINKVLSECIALSFTQHAKHIDIPEGGSKGAFMHQNQKELNFIAAAIGYIDGLVNSMTIHEKIAVASGAQAVDPLELGPDEGTAEIGTLASVRAWTKGLKTWRLLMSGKLQALGGVSHMDNNLLSPPEKGNRVTSQGVMVHAVELVRYLRDAGRIRSKDTEPIRLSITGGMRGDVASGIVEIAIRHYKDKAKMLTLADSSAVIFDPEGLDHGALLKMYAEKAQAKKFPREKLRNGGFIAEVKKGDTTEESYTILGPETLKYMNTKALSPEILKELHTDIIFREQVNNQTKLRPDQPLIVVLEKDEDGHPTKVKVHNAYLRDAIFFLAKSDLLLTGGGGKDSINDKNWQLFFDWNNEPTAVGIVHGANVFISDDANNNLESQGVVIEPDEKANSVGVEISSRMEIDFNTLFDMDEITPELIKSYFEQVLSKCLENAKKKFWALRIEAEDHPEKSVVTYVSPMMSERIIYFAKLIEGSQLVADRESDYSQDVLNCLKEYFPDVSRLDNRFKRTLSRVFERMPSSRIKAIVSKMIAKEAVLNLGLGVVDEIAKATGRSELEVVEVYLQAQERLNINAHIKDLLENKKGLSPREQNKRLRALRQKAKKRVEVLLKETKQSATNATNQSRTSLREGSGDTSAKEGWPQTRKEAEEDLKAMREKDGSGHFFPKGTKYHDELEAIASDIEAAVQLVSDEMAKNHPGSAITNNRIGVVLANCPFDYTMGVTVDPKKKERILRIYKQFVEGIRKFRHVAEFTNDSSPEHAKARQDVLDRLVMGRVLHEIGHGFEGFSNLDCYSLLNDPNARAHYTAFAKEVGYDINKLTKGSKKGMEFERGRFAEAIADLFLAGPGGKEYIENKAAYLLYYFVNYDPRKYVGNSAEIRSDVKRYFEKNQHLDWVLKFVTGTDSVEAARDKVAQKVVEYHDAFFGEGSIGRALFLGEKEEALGAQSGVGRHIGFMPSAGLREGSGTLWSSGDQNIEAGVPWPATSVIDWIRSQAPIGVDASLTTLEFLLKQGKKDEFIQMALAAQEAGAASLHIDIFDPNLVTPDSKTPNGNMDIFTAGLVNDLRTAGIIIPIHAHFMVRIVDSEEVNPKLQHGINNVQKFLEYIYEFISAGANIVTVHTAAFSIQHRKNKDKDALKAELLHILKFIQDRNVVCGLAVNPDENAMDLIDYLGSFDFPLIMTVVPGAGGKGFDARGAVNILRANHVMKDSEGFVANDGAVNADNIARIFGLGVKFPTIGSTLFGKEGRLNSADNLVSTKYTLLNKIYQALSDSDRVAQLIKASVERGNTTSYDGKELTADSAIAGGSTGTYDLAQAQSIEVLKTLETFFNNINDAEVLIKMIDVLSALKDRAPPKQYFEKKSQAELYDEWIDRLLERIGMITKIDRNIKDSASLREGSGTVRPDIGDVPDWVSNKIVERLGMPPASLTIIQSDNEGTEFEAFTSHGSLLNSQGVFKVNHKYKQVTHIEGSEGRWIQRDDLRLTKRLPKPRIVLFDVDGVLVPVPPRERQWGRVARALEERFGISIPNPMVLRDEVFYLGGREGIRAPLYSGKISGEEYINRVNSKLKEIFGIDAKFGLEEWIEFIFKERAEGFPEVTGKIKQELDEIRTGQTSFEEFGLISDRIPGDEEYFARLLLERYGDRLFKPSLQFISTGLSVSKEDGSIFPLVLQRLRSIERFRDIRPEEILIIDDREENLDRARAFGFQTAHSAFGKGSLGELVRERLETASAEEAAVVKEILKLVPVEWIEGWLNLGLFTQAVRETGFEQLEVPSDEKSILIFSEKATFGEYKDGEYEEGLGVILPSLAKSGVKVAVVATTDKQKALIDELNEGLLKNQKIVYADSVTGVTAKVKAARYYYYKIASEPEAGINGVTSITIIVKKIIDAIGKVANITDVKLIEQMHEAARKFAMSA